MRRNVFIIFIIILVLLISGCATNDKKASAEMVQTNSPAEISENSGETVEEHTTDAKQEADTIVLDSMESINEITFLVPSGWRKEEIEDGRYFYPNSDNDVVIYSKFTDISAYTDFDIYNKDSTDEFIIYMLGGIEGSATEYKLVSNNTGEFINGSSYSLVNYTSIINDKMYDTYSYVFFTEKAVYQIVLAQPNLVSDDLKDTVTRIFNSITIEK